MNVKTFKYHVPADTVDQQCLKNPEIQKKLFLEYPMMSLIQPFQAGAITRGAIGEHVSETKKYVLKGFVSASKNITAVKINGVESLVKPFDEHQYSWEKEVDLNEGKNQFQVIAVTDDGKENCQDVILIYNKAEDKVAAPGKNYSLVIGINEYKNIKPLSAARKDATDFKDLLQQYYRFEAENSIALLDQDATRDNIDSVFSLLISKLTANDNLVVYFAGHGLLDKQLNEGYWIPVEARFNKRVDYIPNGEIKKYLEALKAKHVVVFADACFSGGFFKTTRGESFADKIEKLRSKWLFCSGREEEVADVMSGQKNSPFAFYLMKFLKEYKGEGMAVSELAQMVKVAVSNNANQTPISGAIRETGDEGGEFVFRKK
jgi:Caspase domain